MSQVKVLRFADATELARWAADEWLKLIRENPSRQKPFCVALAGGRVARRFLSEVAQQAKTKRQSLGQIEFFWSDERCVPPDHPESNFRLARESLLGVLDIPSRQVHRIRGEEDPVVAAREAEAELRGLTAAASNEQPVVDLVFLGMGEEGHVASLFPGEPQELIESPAVFRPVTAAKPPPKRITMGYPALAAARRLWVLASGEGKEEALQQSLATSGQTPLARVLRSRHQTRIFTDLK